MKLSSNTRLYKSLTGFSTGFCEERIRFGPAFDGARLDTVRAVGIDDQTPTRRWQCNTSRPIVC
jgi:hypothetical protein